MSKRDLISVVIANYNRPELALRAIHSALSQETDKIDIEVILCDDCSTYPVSRGNLEKLGEKVKYLRTHRNMGPQGARNLGMDYAKGNFIAILDDDDEFLPGALQLALDKIKGLKGWDNFPVFQFARSNGYIPEPYCLVNIDHYLQRELKGDFTPVFLAKYLKEFNLRFSEEIWGVGCEHLLWWEISLRWGIPTWMEKVVELNDDADARMTSIDTYLKKPINYAQMEDLSIAFLTLRGLDQKHNAYYELKMLGSATYYMLGGKGNVARVRLKEIKSNFIIQKKIVWALSYMPYMVARVAFKLFRR
jgi:glycosyltransferase involved in cell wall biosynthesis